MLMLQWLRSFRCHCERRYSEPKAISRCFPAPAFPRYNQMKMIRFSTAGESHGEALIALVSGLPAGIPVDLEFVNRELWRRQQGYGRGGRMKIETDNAHVLSGVRHGKTIGSPIAIEIVNRDWKN